MMETCHIPDSGTELPVATPISATTTNSAVAEAVPNGSQMRRTTNSENIFMRIVVLSGPTHVSASQGGMLLPITAPLQIMDISQGCNNSNDGSHVAEVLRTHYTPS